MAAIWIAGFSAAVGFTGLNLYSALETKVAAIPEEATKAAKAVAKAAATEAVAEPIRNAVKSTDDARSAASDAEVAARTASAVVVNQLELLEEIMSSLATKSSSLRASILETAEQHKTEIDGVSAQLDGLQAKLERSQRDLTEVNAQLEAALFRTRTDRASLGDANASAPLPTVYMQFAGVQRSIAEALSSRLQTEGYIIPGEERTELALGQAQVRYFHEADKQVAIELVKKANAALSNLGFLDSVILSDFTGFRGTKPRENLIEFWIEPVAI